MPGHHHFHDSFSVMIPQNLPKDVKSNAKLIDKTQIFLVSRLNFPCFKARSYCWRRSMPLCSGVLQIIELSSHHFEAYPTSFCQKYLDIVPVCITIDYYRPCYVGWATSGDALRRLRRISGIMSNTRKRPSGLGATIQNLNWLITGFPSLEHLLLPWSWILVRRVPTRRNSSNWDLVSFVVAWPNATDGKTSESTVTVIWSTDITTSYEGTLQSTARIDFYHIAWPWRQPTPPVGTNCSSIYTTTSRTTVAVVCTFPSSNSSAPESSLTGYIRSGDNSWLLPPAIATSYKPHWLFCHISLGPHTGLAHYNPPTLAKLHRLVCRHSQEYFGVPEPTFTLCFPCPRWQRWRRSCQRG